MSEQDMRQKVVKMLRPLNAVSVENPVYPGTPDVNYVEGWLELKWLREWPKRESTIVRLPHYTQEQRIWHRMRWEFGGNVYLLLQVRREWLLFAGDDAASYVGKCTRERLSAYALEHWLDGITGQRLIQYVRCRN